MPELSETRAAGSDPGAVDISERVASSNRQMLDVFFGVQRIVLEELVFAGNELLDRTRTETHLFMEFISKTAGAHSVNGIQTMLQECGQHQIEFLRRDCERLFRHGQRMIDASLKLAAVRGQAGQN
ncbi:hypothetical protein [Bradyrhizobium sp. SZCCHNR2032]|uniref:hypothetical protein n=1 Tax=Bradyrhizobium sp. SZCCHNR2032 TaxID=3057384 RepID=UPI0029167F8E|nr:hypothetical protein [Bradyrhizobium sp. SZCCHNR2032]